ncbi:MAG: FecR family protein [Mucilaginibacter sp.]
MNQNELQNLAAKYLSGEASAEEKNLLEQWYNTIHDGDRVVNVSIDQPESEADVKRRIFANLQLKINETPQIGKHPRSVRRLVVYIVSAAATVIFIASSLALYFNRSNPAGNKTHTQIAKIVAPRIMEVILPDGSKVWLSAHSIFKYPKVFLGKTRQVELMEGRAFFDVKHQSDHPFIVKTQGLNITVLGTSFDVSANQKEGTTKVSVVSGKVGVTFNDKRDQHAIMLLPKQQIVLSNTNNQIKKEPAQEAVVNLWCKSPLVFEQENLNNIFKALEKQYNTRITVDNKQLLDERISITLSNQHLDTIMAILSFTKHFKYKIANDSTVVIK